MRWNWAKVSILVSRSVMPLPSRWDHHRRQIDPVHVRLRGQRTRDVGLGNSATFNQKIDNVVLAVQARARFVDLVGRNQPNVLEDFEDVIFVLLHSLGNLTPLVYPNPPAA